MFSNGNSFANGNSHSDGQGMFAGEQRSTEPWFVRMWGQVQPHATD